MKTSLVLKIALLGGFAYLMLDMMLGQNKEATEHRAYERSMIEKQREARSADEEIINQLLSNLDALGIEDPNLANCIKRELGYGFHKFKITKNTDPTVLTELNCSNKKISSLEGIEHFNKLTELDLSRNNLSSVKALSNLNELTQLNLSFSGITTLFGMTNLRVQTLKLQGVKLEKINELLRFPAIKTLKYTVSNDYDCRQLNNFFIKLSRESWHINRPSQCVDQYDSKIPFN